MSFITIRIKLHLLRKWLKKNMNTKDWMSRKSKDKAASLLLSFREDLNSEEEASSLSRGTATPQNISVKSQSEILNEKLKEEDRKRKSVYERRNIRKMQNFVRVNEKLIKVSLDILRIHK